MLTVIRGLSCGVCLLFPLSHWSTACRGQEAPLGEGWKSAIDIPECRKPGVPEATGAKIDLWVEKGWVVVRRTNGDSEPQWQVVLARASEPQPPDVRISRDDGALEIRYRGYFIREASTVEGRMRIYREPKTEQSPEWPLAAVIVQGQRRNVSQSRTAFQTWRSDSWWWVEAGSLRERPDLFLRLRPGTMRPIDQTQANGAMANWTSESVQGGSGVSECHLGDSHAQDEGDLFVANRATTQMATASLQPPALTGWIAKRGLTVDVPPIIAREWLNAEGKPLLLLDNLKGKVVLVQFLAPEQRRYGRDLKRLEELHTKYAKQGLEVIGTYPPDLGIPADQARKVLDEHRITVPVLIGRPAERASSFYLPGETAGRLGVEALPTCFLFDRRGKIVVGFGMEPPEDSIIVAQLLLDSPAPPLDAREWLGTDKPLSLEALKGKVVMLVFSDGMHSPEQTWDYVQPHYEAARERGLVMVGVFRPFDGQAAKDLFAAARIKFPIAVDTGETAKRYAVPGIDTILLIDKSGRIVWSGAGFAPIFALPARGLVDELLKAN